MGGGKGGYPQRCFFRFRWPSVWSAQTFCTLWQKRDRTKSQIGIMPYTLPEIFQTFVRGRQGFIPDILNIDKILGQRREILGIKGYNIMSGGAASVVHWLCGLVYKRGLEVESYVPSMQRTKLFRGTGRTLLKRDTHYSLLSLNLPCKTKRK